RNKQLRESKRAKDGQPVRCLPEELPRWRRRYICTHGWTDRSRGQGVRPQRQIRSTACPFRLTAESVYIQGSWRVEIRFPVYTHNHALLESVYDNYSHIRQVPMCEPLVGDLRLIVRSGGKSLRNLRVYS
ncbi:hypothetical protein L915_08642, partial [Phytophthora nicotianae]